GPWPASEQQLMAAFLIREQHLQPLTRAVNDWPACLREHPAGALWLGQQYGLAWPALAQLPATLTNKPLPVLPTRDQWAQWRLQPLQQPCRRRCGRAPRGSRGPRAGQRAASQQEAAPGGWAAGVAGGRRPRGKRHPRVQGPEGSEAAPGRRRRVRRGRRGAA